MFNLMQMKENPKYHIRKNVSKEAGDWKEQIKNYKLKITNTNMKYQIK